MPNREIYKGDSNIDPDQSVASPIHCIVRTLFTQMNRFHLTNTTWQFYWQINARFCQNLYFSRVDKTDDLTSKLTDVNYKTVGWFHFSSKLKLCFLLKWEMYIVCIWKSLFLNTEKWDTKNASPITTCCVAPGALCNTAIEYEMQVLNYC